MRGSPVKLGIIIVLAVVGVVTLASAFDSGVPSVPTGDASVTQSPGLPKPSRSPHAKPDVVAGVHVGVYNGTKVTGEAAIVAKKLTNQAYVVDETGNTVDPIKTTTVYFVKPADEEAATTLASQFTGAAVELAPDGLTVQDSAGNEVSPVKSARLLVFVGDDYVAK